MSVGSWRELDDKLTSTSSQHKPEPLESTLQLRRPLSTVVMHRHAFKNRQRILSGGKAAVHNISNTDVSRWCSPSQGRRVQVCSSGCASTMYSPLHVQRVAYHVTPYFTIFCFLLAFLVRSSHVCARHQCCRTTTSIPQSLLHASTEQPFSSSGGPPDDDEARERPSVGRKDLDEKYLQDREDDGRGPAPSMGRGRGAFSYFLKKHEVRLAFTHRLSCFCIILQDSKTVCPFPPYAVGS